MRIRTKVVAAVVAVLACSVPAHAHVGSLADTTRSATIPTWLTILTGGAIVGGSFLFTSLLTDHEAVDAVNALRYDAWSPSSAQLVSGLQTVARLCSVGVLGLVLYSGFVGPLAPMTNFAILVVWAGWWAGYSMTVYLLGNTWPVLNPWRAVAEWLPSLDREYPTRYGTWPAVVGLLAMVWVEVVSPLASAPRLLAGLVLAYSLVTLTGAVVFGERTWFETVDPVSGVYRTYGRLAPVQFVDGRLTLRLPSTQLTERRTVESTDEVAFVVALLWVTSFDGVVSTSVWNDVARAAVDVGLPPLGVYLGALLVGYGTFFGAYRWAAARARAQTGTLITERFIAGWFAPALVPIAAGYHLAHFVEYFLVLSPALLGVLASPLTPPSAVHVLVPPDWFVNLQLLLVILGHVLAIWVAHSLALDRFPGTIRPIRSQYPFIVVMVFYTMTSLWIITEPYVDPAFL